MRHASQDSSRNHTPFGWALNSARSSSSADQLIAASTRQPRSADIPAPQLQSRLPRGSISSPLVQRARTRGVRSMRARGANSELPGWTKSYSKNALRQRQDRLRCFPPPPATAPNPSVQNAAALHAIHPASSTRQQRSSPLPHLTAHPHAGGTGVSRAGLPGFLGRGPQPGWV
jgi:hypothetical protein